MTMSVLTASKPGSQPTSSINNDAVRPASQLEDTNSAKIAKIMNMSEKAKGATAIAKEHYESKSAQVFYNQVWGGEFIHIGLFDELTEEESKLDSLPKLVRASEVATDELLRRCFPPGCPDPSTMTLMDLGSGTGGTARIAAKRYGCKVICINVAARENKDNRKLSKEAGLEDKIIIPGERSFFNTELPADSVDVIFTQDSLLHAGLDRYNVLAEVARLLKPGGLFVMSDIMQSEEATFEQVKEACNRLHIENFGTPEGFKKAGTDSGLELLNYTERTSNMALHYNLILDILLSKRNELTGVTDEFFDRNVKGLTMWNQISGNNLMRWGYFVFKKPGDGGQDNEAAKVDQITKVARDYYESDNAQMFYKQIWGGDWIHVGQHDKLVGEDDKLEGPARISRASTLGTQELFRRCFPADGPAPETCTIMDFGSGVGGAARLAAKEYGCKVICINVASRENAENAELSKAAGLSDKVIIPGERSFFDTQLPAESVDVVFSQDCLLHAGGERHRLFTEAARLLKKGGLFAFTDLMMSEEADPKDMMTAFNRLHIDSMGTPKTYERYGKENGYEMIEYSEMTENMKTHYQLVENIMASKRGQVQGMDERFFESCLNGLVAWNDLANRDLMRWGYFVFKKQ